VSAIGTVVDWDDGRWDAAIENLHRRGSLDASRVRISRERLKQILEAAPRGSADRPRLAGAVFDGASFENGVSFDEVVFDGPASFVEASFGGPASFTRSTFNGRPSFSLAVFHDRAMFDDVVFELRAWFDKTDFRKGVWFNRVSFKRPAEFPGVRCNGDAWFGDATFGSYAVFGGAMFASTAFFSQAEFAAWVRFDKATFEHLTSFESTTFNGDVNFSEALFKNDAWFAFSHFAAPAKFSQSVFQKEFRLGGATFETDAKFDRVTFGGDVDFARTAFGTEADFTDAAFAHARNFGPVDVNGVLILDGTSFLQAADLNVAAHHLRASRGRFVQGCHVRVRRAEVAFEQASFGGPSILTTSSEADALDEASIGLGVGASDRRPKLLSLRRADVGKLLISDIDMRPCRFEKAHNLEELRLEGAIQLPRSPHGPWTSRQMIAEEAQWRAQRFDRDHTNEKSTHLTSRALDGLTGRNRRTWKELYEQQCRLPEWFSSSDPRLERALVPAEIAAIYRSLRKGREDNKDEPGAADLYYGEMEMRRHDSSAPLAGRTIIWLYWLVSGYGLRASRAVISLVITVCVFATLLHGWGFRTHEHFGEALTFSAESTTSLFRAPEQRNLTIAGEWLQIGLRLLGPLFFGLALLSLRGRVKR
jgi:hypothetical protein